MKYGHNWTTINHGMTMKKIALEPQYKVANITDRSFPVSEVAYKTSCRHTPYGA
jgi:hypothetical protein